jgi:hypothetical protein
MPTAKECVVSLVPPWISLDVERVGSAPAFVGASPEHPAAHVTTSEPTTNDFFMHSSKRRPDGMYRSAGSGQRLFRRNFAHVAAP